MKLKLSFRTPVAAPSKVKMKHLRKLEIDAGMFFLFSITRGVHITPGCMSRELIETKSINYGIYDKLTSETSLRH